MKFALLLLSALCLTAAARAERYSHRETVSETHALAADGTVVVRNVNGDIEIRTWDRNEVSLEAEKRAATEEELRAIQLAIKPSGDRFSVEVKLPRRSGWFRGNIRAEVRLTLRVPAGARLDPVETVNSSIHIVDVRGDVRASTVNGRIEATGLTGDGQFETVNGSVAARFDDLRPNQRVALESVNGGLKVMLPEKVDASLETSVVNGSVDCDFPLEVTGRISRRHLRGKIGAGGAEIRAETVNGSIRITGHGDS